MYRAGKMEFGKYFENFSESQFRGAIKEQTNELELHEYEYSGIFIEAARGVCNSINRLLDGLVARKQRASAAG
jgi:hypothetical protein